MREGWGQGGWARRGDGSGGDRGSKGGVGAGLGGSGRVEGMVGVRSGLWVGGEAWVVLAWEVGAGFERGLCEVEVC